MSKKVPIEYTEGELFDLKVRRYVLLPLLITTIVGGWIYFAFKFESDMKKKFLPLISSGDFVLSANTDDVIIEKFKFRAMLKEPVIFPKSKFKVAGDKLGISYNPLNGITLVYFYGRDVQVGDGDTGLIVSSPNLRFEFSRDWLDGDYDNLNFKFFASKFMVKLLKDDSVLFNSPDATIKLTNKLDEEGYYRLDVDFDVKGLDYTRECIDYVKRLKQELAPDLISADWGDKVEKISNYYNKILNRIEPFDYTSNFLLKVSKKQFEDIIAIFKGELALEEAYDQFKFFDDKYVLSIRESLVNSYMRDSATYRLSNDGRLASTSFGFMMIRHYKEEQKQDVAAITTELIKGLVKPGANGFSTEDCENVVKKVLDRNRISGSFYVHYDLLDDTISTLAESIVDKLEIEYKGRSSRDKTYEGTFSISSPNTLIDGIGKLYDAGLKNLIPEDSKGSTANRKYFDTIVDNIKNNGFSFLSAFHDSEILGQKRALKTNISFNLDMKNINLNNLNFKINDKDAFEVLADERVVKFLQSMPKTEAERNQ
ncbi:MAG: hypothetical protein Tsb006_4760 [Rickettsiaceae bacterium]